MKIVCAIHQKREEKKTTKRNTLRKQANLYSSDEKKKIEHSTIPNASFFLNTFLFLFYFVYCSYW